MKILDIQSNLEKVLKPFSDREITIVTAFASGTESVIDDLIKRNNRVNILVGTINAFTSPQLIEFCASHKSNKLKTYVDFRYQSSCHWKLYLIKPNIVIIGSANFTKTGISLERDTLLFIEDESLHQKYEYKIEEMLDLSEVICSVDSDFDNFFDNYRKKHKMVQKALLKTSEHKGPESWLEDEVNQMIPLFIWDSRHSDEITQRSNELLEESEFDITGDDVKDFFTYSCDEYDFPYEEGDVVLTVSNKGSYISFHCFDRIIYNDGKYYIYSLKKKRYKYPFKLDSIKKELKKRIPDWYDEDLVEIHREEIRSLINGKE